MRGFDEDYEGRIEVANGLVGDRKVKDCDEHALLGVGCPQGKNCYSMAGPLMIALVVVAKNCFESLCHALHSPCYAWRHWWPQEAYYAFSSFVAAQ